MNDLLTLDDLARLLVIKHNITREDADLLLQNFLNVIEKGLLTDRYVRIKGLGTFKLIEEDAGNGASSSRIVFVPDVSLKEAVNKPFAHFESVVLNDNVSFDDIEEHLLPDSTAAENETEEECNAVDEVCCVEEGNAAVYDGSAEVKEVEEVENAGSSAEVDAALTDTGMVDDSTNGASEETERHKNGVTVPETVYEHKPEPTIRDTRSNNIPWCLMILVLIIGLVLGGIISWQVLGNRIGESIPAENVQAGNAAEENGMNDVETEETVAAEDSIAKVAVAADNVSDKAENKAEDKVVDKADIDSILQSAGREKKEPAVKEDFYSEKLTYRIAGTIESHKIAKGNTLAKIAYKYYRNKKMWPYIVMHNKDVIKDPNNVPIGTVINIPILEPVE